LLYEERRGQEKKTEKDTCIFVSLSFSFQSCGAKRGDEREREGQMRERERDIESCCVRRKGKRQRKQEFCSLPYSQSDERETFHFFSRYLVLGGQIL